MSSLQKQQFFALINTLTFEINLKLKNHKLKSSTWPSGYGLCLAKTLFALHSWYIDNIHAGGREGGE